jgi:hypothetical protein
MRVAKRVVGSLALATVACGPAPGTNASGTSGESSSEGVTSTMGGSSSESSTGTSTEPCSEVYEGDLVVCSENCVDYAISDPEFLRNVGTVTGRLYVVRSDLEDLSAFECLREVGGGLDISFNDKLRSLAGADRLERIGTQAPQSGLLIVLGNAVLESVDGLDALAEVDGVIIDENVALVRVGLDHLERINGSLYLGWCVSQPFSEMSNAGGANPSLTSLDGFASLVSMGSLFVSGQSALVSIDRFQEMAEAGVEFGDANFHINPNLDTSDIESFMSAAGITGQVCENLGDDTPCNCPATD